MSYKKKIPSSPRIDPQDEPQNFYIAELVQECRVEGYATSSVWVNIHIVKAGSPAEAYAKASKLGKSHNRKYKAGSEARNARWIFRGIRDLIPIYEKIEDGAEVMFEAHERMTEKRIIKMLRAKSDILKNIQGAPA
ncbi:MAG: DUF4288 domain-containing protein [Opitutaceae bacterium]|jgi:hypothetical protein|nr:DUF4288 domain-containing protein [Opitutaceae bacterium]